MEVLHGKPPLTEAGILPRLPWGRWNAFLRRRLSEVGLDPLRHRREPLTIAPTRLNQTATAFQAVLVHTVSSVGNKYST